MTVEVNSYCIACICCCITIIRFSNASQNNFFCIDGLLTLCWASLINIKIGFFILKYAFIFSTKNSFKSISVQFMPNGLILLKILNIVVVFYLLDYLIYIFVPKMPFLNMFFFLIIF